MFSQKGLSGALETLCGQAFGFKQYRLRLLGIYLQASAIISFFFSGIISVIWLYTESILILLHQHHDVSKQAALYLRYLIPGLYAYGFLQNILRFLQTQSDVWSLVFISVLSAGIHFGTVHPWVTRELHWQLRFRFGYHSLCWQFNLFLQRDFSIHGKDFPFNLSVLSGQP